MNVPGGAPAGLSSGGRAFWNGVIAFTELNHGFIAGPQAALSERIAAAVGERDAWADPDRTAAYPSANDVFNEMMNWALIDVYAVDRLETEDAAVVIAAVADIMARRGFPRFGTFADAVVEVAKGRSANVPFASLYLEFVGLLERIRQQP